MTPNTPQQTNRTVNIDRYLNVRGAHSPSLSPSGESISFLIYISGSPQVWTQDAPNCWPTQRTFFDGSVTFSSWSPVYPELICGVEADGRENTQFYQIRIRSGHIDKLTDEPDARHRWGGWSHDGERFAFAADRERNDGFDIYIGSRDGSIERVLASEGWLSPRDWNASDDQLLLSKSLGRGNDLYTLDLTTGECHLLTPQDNSVRFQSPQWGPYNESIYCVTDYQQDTRYLARLELASIHDGLERALTVVDSNEYNVNGLVSHAPSGRMVWAYNVDGYSELTVGQALRSGEIHIEGQLNLPAGVASSLDFSSDGEQIAIAVSSRRQSTDIYTVSIEDSVQAEAVRWTASSTGGLPEEHFIEPSICWYDSFDGLSIPMLLTLPDDAHQNGSPTIIDIHGGPEQQRRPSFYPLAQYFLDRGYVYCEPNIRGSTGYGSEYAGLDDGRNRLDAIRDAQAAARWLADHDAVDPDRIVVLGSSYGGFVALSCLTRCPNQWAAGVVINGIFDLVSFLERTVKYRRPIREAEYGSLTDDHSFLERISPLSDAGSVESPLLVAHGCDDERVPIEQAKRLTKTVPEAETLFIKDMGHKCVKQKHRRKVYTTVDNFLRDTIE